MSGGPRAAVDVGTNSVRLLVVDAAGEPLARELTITRLGYGVDRTGHLDDEALRRTLDVIAGYRDTWMAHGVDHVRIAATSAVRDAADRDRFFASVRDLTGVDAEVLPGEVEAATAFAGATAAVAAATPVLVLDVGGGSTELIVGDTEGQVAGCVSLQLGCVRLTERLLVDDPPSDAQVRDARAEVEAQLDAADHRLSGSGADASACRSLVGVAGTVTTLAALHLGLDRYEATRIHGTVVPADEVGRLSDLLLGMPAEDRQQLGPVEAGRADVLAGGALIVDAVVRRFGFDALIASEADILDGLVA